MSRPSLADHEARLLKLEEFVPYVVDMHTWLTDAGFPNGTGKLLRAMIEERQETISDRQAWVRVSAIVGRRLRFLVKPKNAIAWAAAGVASAALWQLGHLIPIDKIIAFFVHH